jgi:hypothetical protein
MTAQMAEMAVLKEKYLIKNELIFSSTLYFIINLKFKIIIIFFF